MESKDLFEAISSIATFASSLVAMFALWEMKTQRRHSYVPELIVPEVWFNYTRANSHLETWRLSDTESLALQVKNIGLGVAKNIEFVWRYDVDAMLATFEGLSGKTGDLLRVDKTEDKLTWLVEGKPYSGCSFSADEKKNDYLLTSQDGNQFIELPLPLPYMTMASAILRNGTCEEIFKSEKFEAGLSSLELSIRYEDIGGVRIRRKFKVDIKIYVNSAKHHGPPHFPLVAARGKIYIQRT